MSEREGRTFPLLSLPIIKRGFMVKDWLLCKCTSSLTKNQYGDTVRLPKNQAFQLRHNRHVAIIDELDYTYSDLDVKLDFSTTIVTRLMGRLDMLKETLPTWLKVQGIKNIIIVDWGCKEPLQEYVDSLKDDRIIIVHVPDKEFFDAGASWNVGIRYAKTEWIFTVDCDVKIYNQSVLKYMTGGKPDNRAFYNCAITGMALSGTALFTKDQWNKTGGYCEGLKGWGGEDIAFLDNMEKKAEYARIRNMIPEWFEHIQHDESKRSENMQDKSDRYVTNSENMAIMENDEMDYTDNKQLCNIYESGKLTEGILI